MTPIIDARRPGLWQDTPPPEMWTRWKAALERKVTDLFRPDRSRPLVEVRDAPDPRPESGGR